MMAMSVVMVGASEVDHGRRVPGRFEHAIERLDEEVVAPHDALVHAEPATLVVDAVAQDPLPGGIAECQEVR